MADSSENTLTSYLGSEFQENLMWQLLVEPEFADKTIPQLSVEYFDNPNLKRLYLIIYEYHKEFGKVPNLQNQSIHQAINLYKTPNNLIEEESLYSVLERIKLWNERILNKQLQHNGDVIQKSTNTFIRQQEYRKLGEFIIEKTKNGEIKQRTILFEIDEKIQKIGRIGDQEDHGTDVTEGIESALRKEFRQTIPTGVIELDRLTGGGLGRGEIGLILSPSGAGKTSLLTKIANTAREQDYNVLQIIFEDTVQQIQRKHFTIWTGIPLSELDERNEEAKEKTSAHIAKLGNKGRLLIKRFSQDGTTMKDITNWITAHQKREGFKFDIVILDYIDCLDAHKKSVDRTEAELAIIKSFEAMASDLDIPAWTAVQSGRAGIDAELVEAHHTGGSIKRLQKAHFFMSIAKTPEQKEANIANVRIIKARFAKDGQTFRDSIFNNDTMQIVFRDEKYTPQNDNAYIRSKYGEIEIDKFNERKKEIDLKNGIDHSKISNAYDDAILSDLKDRYIGMDNTVKAEIETVGDVIPDTEHNILIPKISLFGNENNLNGDKNVVIDMIDNANKTDNDKIEDAIIVENNNDDTISDNKNTDNDNGETKTDDLLIIDNNDIEKINDTDNIITDNITTDSLNNTVIKTDNNIDDIFHWTGETYTDNIKEPEVKFEDIPPLIIPGEGVIENKSEIISPPLIIPGESIVDIKSESMPPLIIPGESIVDIKLHEHSKEITLMDIVSSKNNKVSPIISDEKLMEIERKMISSDDAPSTNKRLTDLLRGADKNEIKKE